MEQHKGERTMSVEHSNRDTPTTSSAHLIDLSKIAYQLPQPMGMVTDALIAGGLMLDGVAASLRDPCQSVPLSLIFVEVVRHAH
jgi:hypothetical protein